ncbi:uncharacterized protein KY384_006585 [Bacidia gigantensis]|uniref:uncharacterized protein n=1 Tax=Bacidia gigantensis TaxID=2732470 RepID=UPI001D03ECBA|nr:uncharacterized protein KY384_006585 [Bacidia gigantensis]KAG8528896.1 hypothetical protein KY384_006585 [Bacidia gigantensis]
MQTELAHLLHSTPSKIQVLIDGLPGDQVNVAYMRRMKENLALAKKKPYDWIVIMGGTNDLGWGQQADVIFDNLKSIWSTALESGASILALNIIETARASDRMVAKRRELNEHILNHQANRFYAFDLWSVIRYTGVDKETRARIWDDGLHLTEEGYNIMGKAVAARLFEIIQGLSSGDPSPAQVGQQMTSEK